MLPIFKLMDIPGWINVLATYICYVLSTIFQCLVCVCVCVRIPLFHRAFSQWSVPESDDFFSLLLAYARTYLFWNPLWQCANRLFFVLPHSIEWNQQIATTTKMDERFSFSLCQIFFCVTHIVIVVRPVLLNSLPPFSFSPSNFWFSNEMNNSHQNWTAP